jgi:hypothetical protein
MTGPLELFSGIGAHDGPLFFLLSVFFDRLDGYEKPSKKQLPISLTGHSSVEKRFR